MVEGQSVLAPGSLLPPGRLIPRGQLWAGCPAQYVRDLSADEVRVPAASCRLTAVTLQSTSQAAATAAMISAAWAAPMATALTVALSRCWMLLDQPMLSQQLPALQSSSIAPEQVQLGVLCRS